MTCLRLHPGISVIPTRAGLLLRSDLATFQVTGADARAFLERLVPLLDGTRDVAAIQAALADRSASSVAALLEHLLARGILEPAGASASSMEVFLRAFPGDAEGRMRRFAEARVLVTGRARWAETVARELSAAGARVDTMDIPHALAANEPASLLIAALPPDDEAAIERLSRAAHAARIRSLWAHATRYTSILGPLVVPGETACRLCATAESVNPALQSTTREPPSRSAETRLGHLVAMEALALLTGYTASRLGGRVLIEDLPRWTSALHTLVRLPWCRVCGEAR